MPLYPTLASPLCLPDPVPLSLSLSSSRQDVRLAATFCLAHLMRLAAPETPYTTAQLWDVMAAFVGTLRRLGDEAPPGAGGGAGEAGAGGAFALCVSVLEALAEVTQWGERGARASYGGGGLQSNLPRAADPLRSKKKKKLTPPPALSQVKVGLLALDFDTPAVARDLATVVFDTISPANAPCMRGPAFSLLAAMVDEGAGPGPGGMGGEAPPALVDAVLARLLPARAAASPAAAALARDLLTACQSRMQPRVQRLLVRAVNGEEGGGGGGGDGGGAASDDDDDGSDDAASPLARRLSTADTVALFGAVHAAAPTILLVVLPHLTKELVADEPGRRLRAADLVAGLLLGGEGGGEGGGGGGGEPGAAAGPATTTTAPPSAHREGAAALDAAHPDLAAALLRRCRDKAPGVRRHVLGLVPRLLCSPAASGGGWAGPGRPPWAS